MICASFSACACACARLSLYHCRWNPSRNLSWSHFLNRIYGASPACAAWTISCGSFAERTSPPMLMSGPLPSCGDFSVFSCAELQHQIDICIRIRRHIDVQKIEISNTVIPQILIIHLQIERNKGVHKEGGMKLNIQKQHE